MCLLAFPAARGTFRSVSLWSASLQLRLSPQSGRTMPALLTGAKSPSVSTRLPGRAGNQWRYVVNYPSLKSCVAAFGADKGKAIRALFEADALKPPFYADERAGR